MTGPSVRRLSALLEVLGIYAAGSVVAGQLSRLFSLQLENPLATFKVDITNAELVVASWTMFLLLSLQYAGWFLLILPLGWWRAREKPSHYGLTRAGHSWTSLLLIGLATAALVEWPVLSVSVADSILNLGETAAWRQAFFDTSWRRWEFWLFSAVMSWAFIPIAEELFFRGYCQRRLAAQWGDGAAILGTACLFTFSHTQYLLPNAYSIGMVVSLFLLAAGLGLVFSWTRSLVPSVLAHAIINLPMTPFWQGLLLAIFLIAALALSRRAFVIVRQIYTGATAVSCSLLAFVGISYSIAAAKIDRLQIAAIAMILFAIWLEARNKRARQTPPSLAASV